MRPRSRTPSSRGNAALGADPHYGKFSNQRGLTASEIDTIVKSADGGTPQGDPRDLPRPTEWVEGWASANRTWFRLPMPFESRRAASSNISTPSSRRTSLKTAGFRRRKYAPTEREVVHHLIAFVREPKSKWFRGQPAGIFFAAPKVSADEETEAGALPSDFLVGYAPGQPAEILEPGRGSSSRPDRTSCSRCTTRRTAMPRTDRTRLGIVFAKQPSKERVLTLSAVNDKFRIPPGDPNHRVDASFEVGTDVKLVSLHPHMHGRGKDFEYRAVFLPARPTSCSKCPVSTGTGSTGTTSSNRSRSRKARGSIAPRTLTTHRRIPRPPIRRRK